MSHGEGVWVPGKWTLSVRPRGSARISSLHLQADCITSQGLQGFLVKWMLTIGIKGTLAEWHLSKAAWFNKTPSGQHQCLEAKMIDFSIAGTQGFCDENVCIRKWIFILSMQSVLSLMP